MFLKRIDRMFTEGNKVLKKLGFIHDNDTVFVQQFLVDIVQVGNPNTLNSTIVMCDNLIVSIPSIQLMLYN